ncbi:hypothetical protein [Brasilonema bromeliae]|uniref:Bacteriocin n=1 Tax=Brasilonema bromeliae SPC951 TaxID=385972 RepID=A0ABX1P3H3_9CYAN|nr:hypothetical protein [Brasilonema bromeliae]NMG18898.1 hypothetical protein [Brasilonema bromeliae SPC951]
MKESKTSYNLENQTQNIELTAEELQAVVGGTNSGGGILLPEDAVPGVKVSVTGNILGIPIGVGAD